MKIRYYCILLVVCVATSFAPALAGPVGVQRNLSLDQRAVAIQQLQAKQEQVGRQLPEPPKGPAMVRYFDKRSQLQDLINKIQTDQPVSPDEIGEALGS